MRSACTAHTRITANSWLTSSGSATECLGFHLGGPQSANLGDGNGAVNQTTELRWDYGSTGIGTCLESLAGGNHLRYVSCTVVHSPCRG